MSQLLSNNNNRYNKHYESKDAKFILITNYQIPVIPFNCINSV